MTIKLDLKRSPNRSVKDHEVIRQILDSSYLCHVGFEDEGQVYVIPTLYAMWRDRLIIHGSKASRMLGLLRRGQSISLTITIVDALVLARSVFHHSMNYRSVMLFGVGEEIKGEDKTEALEALVEAIIPGRSAEARGPNKEELAQTAVFAFNLDQVSCKVRTGPPSDEEADLQSPIWSGTLDVDRRWQVPVSDEPSRGQGLEVPPSVARLANGSSL